MKTYTLEEWQKEGKRLFGDDFHQWKFKCVRCGEVQTLQDFLDAGITLEGAEKRFYYSCIGRWVEGRGCDWTLGGLFRIHKVEVIDEDGDKIPAFEFAT